MLNGLAGRIRIILPERNLNPNSITARVCITSLNSDFPPESSAQDVEEKKSGVKNSAF
jgi:hypothetical protein